MTRRVIFPDPDIWTRKENPMNINPNNAGDLRRSGAFIKHHAHGNRDGMNAILTEALEVNRPGAFIEGILCTFDAIVPQLVTPAGQRGMAELLLNLANDNHPDYVPDHWNRAARFLIAYGSQETTRMNQIMRETDDVSPTIVGILDVYTVILPMLQTPFGINIISNGINTLAAKEAEGDR